MKHEEAFFSDESLISILKDSLFNKTNICFDDLEEVFNLCLLSCFSPRKGKTKKLDDYVEAETRGQTDGNCGEVYGQCPLSIRKILPETFINKVIMKKKKK
jgi:hypothetical protein